MSDQPRSTVLLFDAGGYRCALALPDVAEVMRPLPIEAVTGVPDAVRGIALIRRAPVPVVDLASILQDGPPAACTRLVCVRTGQRTVALGVDRVFGVRELPASLVSDLPPLLRAARPGVIEAIGALVDALGADLESRPPAAARHAGERPGANLFLSSAGPLSRPVRNGAAAADRGAGQRRWVQQAQLPLPDHWAVNPVATIAENRK